MEKIISKIVILGGTGKVGKSIINELNKNNENIKYSIIHKHTQMHSDMEELKNADLVIDFSCASAIIQYFDFIASKKIPIISGTTGITPEINDIFKKISLKIPFFYSANMSVLVHAVKEFLSKYRAGYDIGIVDIHRKGKLDSPSGTSKLISTDNANIVSLRLGDTFGEHIVIMTNELETLELRHKILDRKIFASQSIKIGKWLINQEVGFYQMNDYLNNL